MENSDWRPNRSHPAAEDLKCSCGGEEGAARETPRRGGCGRGRRGGCGRSAGSRLPAPCSRPRAGGGPSAPRARAAQPPARPRTCHGCIPERPSVEDQGQLADAARRGWAEKQQQQRQEETRLPHHSCAPRPPPKVTAAADSRPVNPELVVPAPRPSPRPPLPWGAGPDPQFSRAVVSAAPREFSGHHSAVGWC